MFWKEDRSEEPLLSDDEEGSLKKLPVLKAQTKSFSWASSALICFSISTLVLAIIAAVCSALVWHTTVHPQHERVKDVWLDQEIIMDCGHSPEEARARGCEFDVMSYSWTPAPCFNATLSEMYWKKHNFTFWRDIAMTSVVPNEEILAAKYEWIFTEWRLHLTHCEYLLHRVAQSAVFGSPTDTLMRNLTHSVHCLNEVATQPDAKEGLLTGFGYLTCSHGVGPMKQPYFNKVPDTLLTMGAQPS